MNQPVIVVRLTSNSPSQDMHIQMNIPRFEVHSARPEIAQRVYIRIPPRLRYYVIKSRQFLPRLCLLPRRVIFARTCTYRREIARIFRRGKREIFLRLSLSPLFFFYRTLIIRRMHRDAFRAPTNRPGTRLQLPGREYYESDAKRGRVDSRRDSGTFRQP